MERKNIYICKKDTERPAVISSVPRNSSPSIYLLLTPHQYNTITANVISLPLQGRKVITGLPSAAGDSTTGAIGACYNVT